MRTGEIVTLDGTDIRIVSTRKVKRGLVALGETVELTDVQKELIAIEKLPREWAERWYLIFEGRVRASKPKFIAGAEVRWQEPFDLRKVG